MPTATTLRRLVPNADTWLLWTLGIAALALLLLHPQQPLSITRLIDWQTIGALAGLLIVTKGIESSGALQTLARRVLERVTSMRRLALMLTALSAALAAIVTNDVCLFLLVPLTRALAQQAELPLARIVALEALAVNAGSALTPIGNPQNLFLWQVSGIGFADFVLMMLPSVAIMLGLLLLTAWRALPAGPVSLRSTGAQQRPAMRLLWTSAGLFLPFVLALNFHLLWPALIVVTLVFLIAHRQLLLQVDWTLLLIIALMFIDMRLLAALPAVHAWLGSLPIGSGLNAYLAALLTSQVLSNVPAAILLAPFVHDLPALAAGVSVGGFGLFIGSLANLIALRLSGAPGGLRVLHLYSIPFLLVCGAAVAVLQL
ncbi:MAG: Citrate transporter [Hydrocarboniphaga sp.]|uniref:SLC13 family permease n=1 Tax=Hydrocarboniphaga sp. TaxID=2033016 RepID=UPI00261AA30D|nr:SLC13 family permease [Hydrocarboniphaga sp.]MDB5972718.1 Citrate transporter [Hydrocarboniphaga sp.]